MIELRITGDSHTDFEAQVRGFMALMGGTAAVTAPVEAPAEAPGKPTPTRSKKTSDATTADASKGSPPAAEPQNSGSVETTETADETSNDTPVTPDAGPATLADVKARAMKYSQAAGPQPLVEMLKLAGSANGKFSEVEALGQEAVDKIAAALSAAGY